MPQVSETMTRGVRAIAPGESLVKAAQAMEELNIGVLPVCDGDRLIGIVTDRDIVVRGVAQECPIQDTKVADVMSEDLVCCFEDESIDEVEDKMADKQIRRVPVVDRDQHLVGMLSLGDLATKETKRRSAETLGAISEPSRPDRSSQSAASGAAGGGVGNQPANTQEKQPDSMSTHATKQAGSSDVVDPGNSQADAQQATDKQQMQQQGGSASSGIQQ